MTGTTHCGVVVGVGGACLGERCRAAGGFAFGVGGAAAGVGEGGEGCGGTFAL